MCKRCKSPVTSGVEQPQEERPAIGTSAAIPKWGVTYGAVTGGLLVAICLLGWCSTSKNHTVHATCLTVWALALQVLTASQDVFLVFGVRDRASAGGLAILFPALVLLGMIGLFVYGLANMPS